jgi:hypothetical protein
MPDNNAQPVNAFTQPINDEAQRLAAQPPNRL